VDSFFGLHHSQLRLARSQHWIRSWLWCNHLWFHLFDDVRDRVYWHCFVYCVSIFGCLDDVIWVHHCELRHTHCRHWVRSWLWCNHLWFHLFDDVCDRVYWHCFVYCVFIKWLLVVAFWLHDCKLLPDSDANKLRDCCRCQYLRLHQNRFMRHGLHGLAIRYFLSIFGCLDDVIWVHHCELRHTHCRHWVRSWLWCNHLWLDLFYDLCNRLFGYRCHSYLPSVGRVDRAVRLQYRELLLIAFADWLHLRFWGIHVRQFSHGLVRKRVRRLRLVHFLSIKWLVDSLERL